MPKIIDTNRDTTKHLARLRAAGIETVIRYYARSMSSKVIRRAEALAIGQAGHAAWHRVRRRRRPALGVLAGHGIQGRGVLACVRCARDRAASRQRGLFRGRFRCQRAEIRTAIIPYFRGVARAFAEDNGLPVYRVGVYGSGAVCAAVLDAGLAELAWVSCSTGWSGYRGRSSHPAAGRSSSVCRP